MAYFHIMKGMGISEQRMVGSSNEVLANNGKGCNCKLWEMLGLRDASFILISQHPGNFVSHRLTISFDPSDLDFS